MQQPKKTSWNRKETHDSTRSCRDISDWYNTPRSGGGKQHDCAPSAVKSGNMNNVICSCHLYAAGWWLFFRSCCMFVFVSAATERSSNVRVVILSRWGEYFLLFPFVQPFQSCRLEIFRRHLFSDLSFLGGKHGKCLARSGCINYGPPLLTLQKSSTTKKLENKKNNRKRSVPWHYLVRFSASPYLDTDPKWKQIKISIVDRSEKRPHSCWLVSGIDSSNRMSRR